MAAYGLSHCNVGIHPLDYNSQHNAGFYIDPSSFQIPSSNYYYQHHPAAAAQLHYNPSIPNVMGYNYDQYYNNPTPAPNHFAQPDIASRYKPNVITDLNLIPAAPGLNYGMTGIPRHPSTVNPPFCNSYYGNDALRDPVFNQSGEIHQQTLRRVIPAIANRDKSYNFNQPSASPDSTNWSQYQQYSGHAGQFVTNPATQIAEQAYVHNSGQRALYPNELDRTNQPEDSSQGTCMPVYNLGFLNESMSGHKELEDSSAHFSSSHNHNPPNATVVQQTYFPGAFQQPYDIRATATHFQRNDAGHVVPRNDVIPGIPPLFQQQTLSHYLQVDAPDVYKKQALPCNRMDKNTSSYLPPIHDDRSILQYGISKTSAPSNQSGDNGLNLPTHTLRQPVNNAADQNASTSTSPVYRQTNANGSHLAAVRAHVADVIEREIIARQKESLERRNAVTRKCDDSNFMKNLDVYIRKASHGIVRESPETYVGLPPFVLNESSNTMTSSTLNENQSPLFNEMLHRSKPKCVSRSVDAVLESSRFQSCPKDLIRDCAPRSISLDETCQRRKESQILSRGEWWRSLPIDQLDHSPVNPHPANDHPPVNPHPANDHPPVNPHPANDHPPVNPHPANDHPPVNPHPANDHPSLPPPLQSSSFLAHNEFSSQRQSRTRLATGHPAAKEHKQTLEKSHLSLSSTSSVKNTPQQESDPTISKALDDEMAAINRNEFHLIVSPRSSRSPTPTGLHRLNRLETYNKNLQRGEIVGIKRLNFEKAKTSNVDQNALPAVLVQQKVGNENDVNSCDLLPVVQQKVENENGVHSCDLKTNKENLASVQNERSIVKQDKTKSNDVTYEKGSIPWKLSTFIKILKTSVVRENNIQTIENCLTWSHIGLKSEYTVEDFQPKGNRPSFYGTLSLSGVFIARAAALNKKTLKHKVYEKALNVLMSHSTQEILALGDILKLGEAKNVHHGMSHLSYMKEKLRLLQDWVRKHHKDNINAIFQLQKAFAESECSLVYSYHATPISDARGIRLYNKCQLLVEEKIIATAISIGRKEAKIKVSEKLMSDLLSLNIDTIYKNLMQNKKEKEIDEEIREVNEQQAKTRRTDPASLLDVLIAKVREHYNTKNEEMGNSRENTIVTEHVVEGSLDDACVVTPTPNACLESENYNHDTNTSNPMTSDKESSSDPMTSDREMNSDPMTSDKESSSDPMTSDRGMNSDPMTSDKESSSDPMTSDKESSSDPMTSDKESSSDPMTSDKETNHDINSNVEKETHEDSEDAEEDGASGNEPGADLLLISKLCIQLRLKLTTVFMKNADRKHDDPPPYVQCVVYVAERLLASVPCFNRKEAQDEAFKQVRHVLLLATSGRDILDNYPIMSPDDLKGENVLDVVFKGYAKITESNRCRLHRTKRMLGPKKREIADLVILEHEDWTVDRVAHANCILMQSASMSGLLLEWTCEEDYGVWRCEMFLQDVNVARCVSRTKRDAVTIASVKALYALYETQPIIKGYHGKAYSSLWVTRKQLRDRVKIPTPAETVIDMEGEATNGDVEREKEEDQLQPEVKKAMGDLVSEFFHQPTLKELIIAPDWTPSERQHMRHILKVKDLRCWSEVKTHGDMMIISMKLDLTQYVEILKAQPTLSQGRYRLLPDSERPSLNDVAGEIAVNESFVCGIQSQLVTSWLERCMDKKNRNRLLYARKNKRDGAEEWEKSGEYVTANDTLMIDQEEEEVFKSREVECGDSDGNQRNYEDGVRTLSNNDEDESRLMDDDDAGTCMKAVMPVVRCLLRPLSTSTPEGEKRIGRKRRIQSEEV